ncbi:MAG: hypothetical protein H6872_14070 [Methylobacteriaceae bacterium]|nr:hypothetical protein [Methylobacteriaceae bacterium]
MPLRKRRSSTCRTSPASLKELEGRIADGMSTIRQTPFYYEKQRVWFREEPIV